MEIHSPPCLVEAAAKRGLKAGLFIDLVLVMTDTSRSAEVSSQKSWKWTSQKAPPLKYLVSSLMK